MDTVKDDAWMSRPKAARRLAVTLIRVGMLIANRRLIPAENPAGQTGVTTGSVHDQLVLITDPQVLTKLKPAPVTVC
ncbi:DNA-binding protein [Streptomyces sp. NPDC102394]|uniref:DNA-binding protein n=1 Tax=Streptomyces sp. NPDC102394 TaxID=3366167 RepID=UPI0037F99744